MQLNIFFLPLLGGYLFYTRWRLTSFFAARCNGQRLVFHSAAIGLALLIAARGVVVMGEIVHPHQDTAVRGALHAVAAGAAVVLIALAWTCYSYRNDRQFHEELDGTAKPLFGGLIALIAAAIFYSGVFELPNAPDEGADVFLPAIAAILLAVACATRSLSRWYRSIDLRGRRSALFLRTSLLVLMTLQVAFLWLCSLDVLDATWHWFSPLDYSGTALMACLLGALSWWPLNLLVDHEIANARLHRDQRTSSLERSLFYATIQKKLVEITLTRGKVYVGWVDRMPANPADSDAHLRILPVRSGYRDSETNEVKFTTYYEDWHAKDPTKAVELVKIVPIANIEVAGWFLEDIYLDIAKTRAATIAAAAAAEEVGKAATRAQQSA